MRCCKPKISLTIFPKCREMIRICIRLSDFVSGINFDIDFVCMAAWIMQLQYIHQWANIKQSTEPLVENLHVWMNDNNFRLLIFVRIFVLDPKSFCFQLWRIRNNVHYSSKVCVHRLFLLKILTQFIWFVSRSSENKPNIFVTSGF